MSQIDLDKLHATVAYLDDDQADAVERIDLDKLHATAVYFDLDMIAEHGGGQAIPGYIGASQIQGLYIGDQAVSAAYIGDTALFP